MPCLRKQASGFPQERGPLTPIPQAPGPLQGPGGRRASALFPGVGSGLSPERPLLRPYWASFHRGRTDPQASEPAKVERLLGAAMRNGGPCPGRGPIDRRGDTSWRGESSLGAGGQFSRDTRGLGSAARGVPKQARVAGGDPVLGRIYASERGNRAARSRQPGLWGTLRGEARMAGPRPEPQL